MAKTTKTIAQNYPRIQDEYSQYYGCLDDSTLVQHALKIPAKKLKNLALTAINNANKKSSREILAIPINVSEDNINKIYEKEGKKLFSYFKKYCGDPASTAHQTYKKNYKEVGIEQFRNRTLQKERMNAGWRYQFLAIECARHSKRFKCISELGASEADFNAIIEFVESEKLPLNLYVSVKNRCNTLGGQDWPKAIQALENVAKNDKNRNGSYCCIFGITIDRGVRYIKRELKSNNAHSINTEVWLSDFFWPFFSNYTYEEIMSLVLEVLVTSYAEANLPTQIEIPEKLLEAFGEACSKAGLLDDNGIFNDAYKLVSFFCNK